MSSETRLIKIVNVDVLRQRCLAGKMTARHLRELGYTKVFGLRIPLELETDEELAEGLVYLRRCRDEAAFYDNVRKYNRLLDSTNAVETEIKRRRAGHGDAGGQHETSTQETGGEGQ